MSANLQPLILLGASGHAKVVLSVAESMHQPVHGLLDDNRARHKTVILGVPVLGPIADLLNFSMYPVCIGIGHNKTRLLLAEQYATMRWQSLVHQTAYVHDSVEIGEGTVVCAGAIIQPGARIGKHCIINTGATVDHDVIIEDYVHLAPGVHLAGGVCIGRGSFFGIGSVAIPNCVIGDWVEVAAGAVVVSHISHQKRVMGVPAKERAC